MIKVELQEWMGSDLSIAQAAWTSSLSLDQKQKRTETDVQRLVNFLAEHKHGTPFESVVFRFWIKAPIYTDRQLQTYRISSQNAASGRYKTMPNEWLKLPDDVTSILEKLPHLQGFVMERKYGSLCHEANEFYQESLKTLKESEKNKLISNEEYKRVREVFRGVLPLSNLTERVIIFNLRSLVNFIKQRDSEHAQPEIREVAKQMLALVKEKNVCPIAIEALQKQGWNI